MSNDGLRPETIAAHALRAVDEATGAVVPPIYTSSTYARDENYAPKLKENYVRNGNPTLWQTEEAIAALEGGPSALLFASGMAAITTLLETVPQGAHVVAPDVMYYGTRDWLKRLEGLGRISADAVRPAADPARWRPRCSKGKTDLVWIETPLNPTWDVIDIEAAAKAAHEAGAILAVDATATGGGDDAAAEAGRRHRVPFGDQISERPFRRAGRRAGDARGEPALEGRRDAAHQDGRTAAAARMLPADARACARCSCAIGSASANAMAIARHFEGHPKVERVLYPGLASHPGHAIAARQMTDGFGGMMSILVKGGFEDAQRLCTRLKVIVPATSLGGVESLAEHRKTVEGPTSPVPDNLVRLSVGIEHVDDLIADLEQALAGI